MLKRNTNMITKLVLFIFLVLLLMFILQEASSLESVSAGSIIYENNYMSKIESWRNEHYYAARTWEYLRQRNFSQAAACGIIGNMMIETSGGTLDLKPNIYSKSGNYFGLCQWSTTYYSGAKDLPFEHQLDYLLGTMPLEFKTFGRLYKDNFNYEDFIILEDPALAALVFAKVYERCSPVSFELRQQAALKAFEYFKL